MIVEKHCSFICPHLNTDYWYPCCFCITVRKWDENPGNMTVFSIQFWRFLLFCAPTVNVAPSLLKAACSAWSETSAPSWVRPQKTSWSGSINGFYSVVLLMLIIKTSDKLFKNTLSSFCKSKLAYRFILALLCFCLLSPKNVSHAKAPVCSHSCENVSVSDTVK